MPLRGGRTRLVAGIQIEIAEGWKTYWRHPGTSGVAPRLDWSGSDNLADAVLLFPAPRRFSDRDGDVIGYAKSVMLPVNIVAKDAGRAVELTLALEYGVCKDVCIPVQSKLSLVLPPDAATRPAGDALKSAIARVPTSKPRVKIDPMPERIAVDLRSPKPAIVIDAVFPDGASGADAFLEAPDGLWLPLSTRAAAQPAGKVRFHVDLTDGADIPGLSGKTIRLTLVSDKGQSETTFLMKDTTKR